jgi:hypothetical protein
MSKLLTSQIDIDAHPTQVWTVLSDLAAYHEWNPFIVRTEGRAEAGARLVLRMQPAEGRAVTLRPTVSKVEVGRRLRWQGRLAVPGLLDAEHTFTMEEGDGGGTRLRQDEEFRGVLVPLLARSLDRGTLPAFHSMNEALKRRVERMVSPRRG